MKKSKGYTLVEILATIVIVALLVFTFICLTGCNKKILDTNYTFNEARCDYGFEHFVLQIDSWTDYDGEQIQVTSNGKTYLLSANRCYLVKY